VDQYDDNAAGACMQDGSAWDDDQPLRLDARGNVRSLLPTQLARSIIFTSGRSDMANRKFTLTWAGNGTLDFFNVNVCRLSHR
jgi:hypothetical protein